MIQCLKNILRENDYKKRDISFFVLKLIYNDMSLPHPGTGFNGHRNLFNVRFFFFNYFIRPDRLFVFNPCICDHGLDKDVYFKNVRL
jgi:hypothetical protein